MNTPPVRDDLVGTIARYSSSNVFRQVMGLANAYLKPKLLGPELYGLWNLLSLIPSYSPYAHLGTRSAMRFRIPANDAAGDQEANREVLGAVFWGSLAINMALAAGLALAAALAPLELPARAGLGAMAVGVILIWRYEYMVALLKARQEFKLLTRANYVHAALVSALNLGLILAFGIYGLYAALVISYAAILVFLARRHKPQSPGPYSHRAFMSLVREGLPIALFNLCTLFIRTSDRIIVSSLLGLEQLGYYGIAAMAMGFLMHVPGAAREVLEPRLMADLAARGERQCLRDYAARPLLATAHAMPLFLAPAVILMPLAVGLVLPRYQPGAAAAQFLVMGGQFLAMAYVLRGVIVAKKRQVAASGLMVLAAAVNVVLSLALVRAGFGVTGVGAASAASFVLLLALLMGLVRRTFGPGAMDAPIPALLAPWLGVAVVAMAVEWTLAALPASQWILRPVGTALALIWTLILYNRGAARYGFWKPLSLKRPSRNKP